MPKLSEPTRKSSAASDASPIATASDDVALTEAGVTAATYQPKFKPFGPPVEAPAARPFWLRALITLALLIVGGAGGYFYNLYYPRTPAAAPDSAGPVVVLPITPTQQHDLNVAFSLMKDGKFLAARAQFEALLKQRPEWTSLKFEIARLALYQRNYSECERLIQGGEKSGDIPVADGEFLTALMRMNNKQFDSADQAFARSAAADPARPDIYYFWGENLRREGKPVEAADRFHAALMRNQYETADTLYTLKLWLSQIQAGQEISSGLNDTLAARLAEQNPSSAILLAAAARSIKAGEYDQASSYMAKSQKVMEPTLFNLMVQDPTFAQESWRPNFASFYPKPKPEPAPPAAPPEDTPPPMPGETPAATTGNSQTSIP